MNTQEFETLSDVELETVAGGADADTSGILSLGFGLGGISATTPIGTLEFAPFKLIGGLAGGLLTGLGEGFEGVGGVFKGAGGFVGGLG